MSDELERFKEWRKIIDSKEYEDGNLSEEEKKKLDEFEKESQEGNK